jgi:ankyrin repeat protein
MRQATWLFAAMLCCGATATADASTAPDRGAAEPAPAAAQAADPARRAQALALLKSREIEASVGALRQAASDGDVALVRALLDAGIDIDAAPQGGLNVFGEATETACVKNVDPAAQRAVIDELVRRGIDVERRDAQGNTALIGAVQSCPPALIEKMLAVGAKPDPVNAQGFTPLQMAFVSGRWDVAETLIHAGARLSAKQADQLFLEKPQDPAQRALVERAIKGR